jgi:glycosyltransferase involved in cell wall biosynthesis
MTATPLVSVYLPTRNRAALLPRAVASVLEQDHTNLELLVVDDASTDATPDVLARLAAADTRVKVFRQDRPGGAPAARNVAIRAASGRYLTGLDDDDEFLPGRITSLLGAFDERYSFVCSGAYVNFGDWHRVTRSSEATITLDDELFADQVGTQILTFKERLLEVGGYDGAMPASQDYDLWTRLIARFGPAFRFGEPTYVVHLDQEIQRVSRNRLEGARRYLEKHRSRMNALQLRQHELKIFMLEGRRMTLGDAARLSTKLNRHEVFRYLTTSNLPFLRRLAMAVRRLRKGYPRRGLFD